MIDKNLDLTLATLKNYCHQTGDLLIQHSNIANIRVAFVMFEGMINILQMSEILLNPLRNFTPENPADILNHTTSSSIFSHETKTANSIDEVATFAMSGFVVLLVDGLDCAVAFGMQGFNFKSISSPENEANLRGSHEAFCDVLRINISLVRRRLKSNLFKIQTIKIGATSQTDITLLYMTDKVSPTLIAKIKSRLSKVDIKTVLDSGYIESYLTSKPYPFFKSVGTTERPDVLTAKIADGRVGILVDGTPFALIVPYLFYENFQSMDDYTLSASFASFTRILKYFCFFLSFLLPSLYVAIVTYHPEMLPHSLLFTIAKSATSTPFPLVLEALIIHIFFEIMREAGLRLPRPIGHAVGVVGGLVIGDAAVSASLVGAPMILIVAITALSSFVVPYLYPQVMVLKFVFIIAGGLCGLFGITVLLFLVIVNIAISNSFSFPQSYPLAPLSIQSMRDVFVRFCWKKINH